MKLTKAQFAGAVFSALLTWWLLGRGMDRDRESVYAAIQRQWLVVGLLLAGGYVVLRYRRRDGQHDQSSGTREIASARYRKFGVVGWVFVFAGTLMALRLIWRTW